MVTRPLRMAESDRNLRLSMPPSLRLLLYVGREHVATLGLFCNGWLQGGWEACMTPPIPLPRAFLLAAKRTGEGHAAAGRGAPLQ